jgi:hypothetical protein
VEGEGVKGNAGLGDGRAAWGGCHWSGVGGQVSVGGG